MTILTNEGPLLGDGYHDIRRRIGLDTDSFHAVVKDRADLGTIKGFLVRRGVSR